MPCVFARFGLTHGPQHLKALAAWYTKHSEVCPYRLTNFDGLTCIERTYGWVTGGCCILS